MKKFQSLIFAILCSTSIALATTYTGTTGDCTYTLDTSDSTLVISGSGAMEDYSSASSVPWYSYRSYVKTVTIEDGVTSIGSYAFAFYKYTSLTSVTIGSGVTSIGDYAFEYCSSLTSITIPDGVTSIGEYAFADCSSLTSINIPDGVTSIGGRAFLSCSSLTSVTIPDGVTSINNRTFGSCTSLTSITIGSGVTSIDEYAIYNCTKLTSITIPDAVTSIGDYAFYKCTSLTSVTIGSGVTSIGDYAFYKCTSLESIRIPSKVKSIGDYAFSDCSDLLKIISLASTPPTIGENTFSDQYSSATLFAASTKYTTADYWSNFTTIISEETTITGACGDNLTYTLTISTDGSTTFSIEGSGKMYDFVETADMPWYTYRNAITSVSLPSGLTTIGDFAFRNCTFLASITIPDGVTTIGDYAFYDCSSLTSINIPDGVTSIDDYTFYNCSSLTSINIPDGVTSINDYAFAYCTSLTSVTFGDNSALTSIGPDAFSHCESLASITIPEGVTSIGSQAFISCDSLSSVTSLAITPPTASSGVFYTTNDVIINNATLYAASTAYAYATCWKAFTNIEYIGGAQTTITGSCGDNLTFTLDFENGTLTISGSGDMYDYSTYSDVPWYQYSSYITSVTLPEGLTSVCDYAFYNCEGLTSITIPDAVTSIGSYAFYNCSSLTSITIPDAVTTIGLRAFYNCSSLTSITIPDAVTTIGSWAFYNCSSLTSVTSLATTPPGCGYDPFSSDTYKQATLYAASNLYTTASYWSDFTTIEYTTTLTTLTGKCGDNLTYTLNLESYELTITGSGDMYDYSYLSPWYTYASSITSITLPDNMTSIGDYAFLDCTSLTSITIPDGVTTIGEGAFCYCTSLTSITIPDAVTSIGSYAFEECTSLTSVTIGSGATSIGDYAFCECTSLTSITIPDAVTSIGSSAFYGCSSLTSVTIGSGVTSIGSSAFRDCSSLKSITIPDGVTSIGASAFRECTSLKSVTLPDSVTTIGTYAFYDCTSLTSITLPETVVSLGTSAFYGCTSITTVTSNATTPPICPSSAFSNTTYNKATLYAANSIYSYVDYWSEFNNIEATTTSSTTISGYCGDKLKYSLSLTKGTLTITGSGDMYDYESCYDVPWYFYSEAAQITSITLSDDMTSIGDYAFYRCYCAITDGITLPDNITRIGDYAFYYGAFSSVALPDSLITIGEGAFNYCYRISSITIPEGVTSVGDYAFTDCSKLTTIRSYNETPPVIYSNTFSDQYSSATLYAATNLYKYADYWKSFYSKSYTTTVSTTITGYCGDNLTYSLGLTTGRLIIRGYGDMYDYTADTTPWYAYTLIIGSIQLPDNMTSIGDYAFYECSSYNSITIPEGVTTIGDYAFYGCTSLTSITSLATTPPVCSYEPFSTSTYSDATLYAASTNYATADYWENFYSLTTAAETDDSTTDGNAIETITIASTSAIRAIGSTIVITTETAQTAQVYSLSGQLVTKRAVSAGETSIGMSAGGIYIVALNDGTRAKVLVK